MLARSLLLASLLSCGACSKSQPLRPAGAAGADESGAAGAAQASDLTVTVFDAARVSSNPDDPNFQELGSDLDLSAGPYASAMLIADLATTCVPFSAWADDPPPKGQNWPADCDAFDRNFEISLDGPEPSDAKGSIGPSSSSEGGTGGESGAGGANGEGGASDARLGVPVGLELVRAITPFGGPMHIERDLTGIANGLSGIHRLHVKIGTWADSAGLVTGSNAGWNVTVRLALNKGVAPSQPLAIIPLFYGDLTSVAEVSRSFTVPEGTVRGYLEYRTTGHGGAVGDAFSCTGPAEEFCKRQHTIKLDGETIKNFTPWKACASHCTVGNSEGDPGFAYCEENPCGAIESVTAPRANWCPGSETDPVVIDPPALAVPGPHDVSVQVSQIAAGGSVRVSLTYYAFAN
ncbi:MAG: peptide-N-glycosidase F-related protein [Pseudomonadota bacterium]